MVDDLAGSHRLAIEAMAVNTRRWLTLLLVAAAFVGAILFSRGLGTSDRATETPAANYPPSGGHPGIIHGSKTDDVLEGTGANEKIEGLAGSDTIRARGGNDRLIGGPGADLLEGGDGDDTYVVEHHGGGPDIIYDEGGTDTLQIEGGRIDLRAVQLLRHGDDLLIRWSHGDPPDEVLIRSWYLDSRRHVEWLKATGFDAVRLEPLAASATEATSADVIHFQPRVK